MTKTAQVLPESVMTVKVPVDWTLGDQNALKIFLNTRTGQKFICGMRNDAIQEMTNAIYGHPETLQMAAGVAKGKNMAFSTICLMAAADPLQVVVSNGISLTESREESESDGPSEDDELPTSFGSPIAPEE